MATIATPRNMRIARAKNPGRVVHALSVSDEDDTTYSASAGDYYMHGEDEPLVDANGVPLILVIEVRRYVDALTGEPA